jgi:glycosyltransferase involved in cell wall biosynthesis
MRVLMMTDAYFPRLCGVAGAVHDLRRALTATGIASDLIAPAYPGRSDGSDVIRIASRSLFFERDDRLMSRAPLLALADSLRGRVDLIHVHTPYVAHTAGVELAESLDVPVIESYHDCYQGGLFTQLPPVTRTAMRSFSRTIARCQCDQVDAVVVPHEGVREALHRYGVRSPIAVIPDPFDLDTPGSGNGEAFRSRHGIGPRRPILLAAGRCTAEKQLDFLVDVAVRIGASCPETLLVIAGDGAELGRLRRRAAREGIADRVLLPGVLDRRHALPDCLAAADLLVDASRGPGHGLAIKEAMAAGLPVVTTHAPGFGETTEVPGLVRAAPTLSSYTAVVLDLLERPRRMAALGDEAREFVRGWSGASSLRRLAALYQLVIDGDAEAIPRVCGRAA